MDILPNMRPAKKSGPRLVQARPTRLKRAAGKDASPLTQLLHDAGVRAWHLQCLSLGSVGLCIALWIRAKTVDQDERGNAERRALFVGLWPPTIWLIGDSLDRLE
jgi:hypothetical protein